MPTNNAKPRAKAANSSASKRRASTSSRPNPPSTRPSAARANARSASAAEARGFKPTKKDGRKAPPALPKAVAKAKTPKRQKPSELSRPPSWRYRKNPILIGQALRRQGFDEHVAAAEYVALVQYLAQENAKVTPALKIRLDVLKECMRHLENAQKTERAAAEAAAADAPVYVQLVHAVPRPDRTAPASDPVPLNPSENSASASSPFSS